MLVGLAGGALAVAWSLLAGGFADYGLFAIGIGVGSVLLLGLAGLVGGAIARGVIALID
jgi:hypothetical protein